MEETNITTNNLIDKQIVSNMIQAQACAPV